MAAVFVMLVLVGISSTWAAPEKFTIQRPRCDDANVPPSLVMTMDSDARVLASQPPEGPEPQELAPAPRTPCEACWQSAAGCESAAHYVCDPGQHTPVGQGGVFIAVMASARCRGACENGVLFGCGEDKP